MKTSGNQLHIHILSGKTNSQHGLNKSQRNASVQAGTSGAAGTSRSPKVRGGSDELPGYPEKLPLLCKLSGLPETLPDRGRNFRPLL